MRSTDTHSVCLPELKRQQCYDLFDCNLHRFKTTTTSATPSDGVVKRKRKREHELSSPSSPSVSALVYLSSSLFQWQIWTILLRETRPQSSCCHPGWSRSPSRPTLHLGWSAPEMSAQLLLLICGFTGGGLERKVVGERTGPPLRENKGRLRRGLCHHHAHQRTTKALTAGDDSDAPRASPR